MHPLVLALTIIHKGDPKPIIATVHSSTLKNKNKIIFKKNILLDIGPNVPNEDWWKFFQKTYVSLWAYHVVVKYKSQFGLESLVYPKPGFTLKTRLSNCPMMRIYNFFFIGQTRYTLLWSRYFRLIIIEGELCQFYATVS